jgi:hypothetical protein
MYYVFEGRSQIWLSSIGLPMAFVVVVGPFLSLFIFLYPLFALVEAVMMKKF